MEYSFCCGGGSRGLAPPPRHFVVIQCQLERALALAISILMILHILYAYAFVSFLPTCRPVDLSTYQPYFFYPRDGLCHIIVCISMNMCGSIKLNNSSCNKAIYGLFILLRGVWGACPPPPGTSL